MPSPISGSRVFFRDETPCPLGRATLAGTIKNSGGVLGRKLRVYGQYALVLLLNGNGIYRDALGYKAQVKRGDLIWVFPEIPHVYGPTRGESWDEIYVCFLGPIFDLWRAQELLDPTRPISHISDWQDAFHKLHNWCEIPRETETNSRLLQLHDFLAILATLVSPAPPTTPPDVFARAKSLLESNLGENVSPESIARELGLGYDSFRKNFLKQTGVSPARFRDLARAEAAKTLLLRGDMNQKTIAQSLGFRDEAHFSRRFRELCDVSPREFRAQKDENVSRNFG